MSHTPCSFFSFLRQCIDEISAPLYQQELHPSPGFPIHPSASELAEEMLVDPDVLKNETYEPGLYDEDGDYYPQYSDDPSEMPEYFEPAPLNNGDAVPEPMPASELASSDESNQSSE